MRRAGEVVEDPLGQLGRGRGDRGRVLADRRLGANALADAERLAEEPVQDRAGRRRLARGARRPRAPGRESAPRPAPSSRARRRRGRGAARPPGRRACRARARARSRRDPRGRPARRRSRSSRGRLAPRRSEVDARCGCRSRATAASLAVRGQAPSAPRRSSGSKARSSRSSTGAFWYEVPTRTRRMLRSGRTGSVRAGRATTRAKPARAR